MVPDAIPEDAFEFDKDQILKYPGIKEDVYVPRFKPDPGIQNELGISQHHLVVTLRPPASEAHYHRPESDSLFEAVIQWLAQTPNAKVILLPRNQKQEVSIRKTWPELFSSGKLVLPARALDGLNLIWYSDLVISGGGTMNREAAALGVPVYSIFRGKIGAIDRYLADSGRLVLVESIEEVRTKILPQHRRRPAAPASRNNGALSKIVDNITSVLSLHGFGRPDSQERMSSSPPT
jgi:predicted glycosyltransferase